MGIILLTNLNDFVPDRISPSNNNGEKAIVATLKSNLNPITID